MRVPVIATARVEWRTISGVDFQVIAPYVMVAKPDRYRAVWVWLRKEQGKWHAHVTAAGAPAGRPVATDRSALGALAVAMDLPVWSQHVQFTPVRVTKIEEWSYPEPERRYQRRPGSYRDRLTAHDSRWDTSRSGGHIRSA